MEIRLNIEIGKILGVGTLGYFISNKHFGLRQRLGGISEIFLACLISTMVFNFFPSVNAACCLSPEAIKNLEQKFRPDLPKPVPKTIPEIKRVQNILNDTLKALQTNNVSKALNSI